MFPHSSVLVLITLSFPLVTRADSQVVQNLEELPGLTRGSDTYADWTELASLFDLVNIADNIRGSFVSNLFGVPSMANLNNVDSEPDPSLGSPDGWSEPLPLNLEVLLSEEAGKIIRSFETVVDSIVTLGITLYDILGSDSPESDLSSHVPLNPLLKKAAKLLAIACDDFREQFPLPAAAPGHAERVESVSESLEDFQRLVIQVVRNHEVEREVVERHLARVRPWLRDVGVFIGDVAELYPAAIEALVLNLIAVTFPEAVFLRSLVILYCFGPYVLGRDAIGGWLSKHTTETLRT